MSGLFPYVLYVRYNVCMILLLHIVTMVLSVVFTVSLFVLAAAGKRTVHWARITNRVITASGVSAGVVLLVQHPILSTCVTLTAYVVVFMAAEYYMHKRVPQTSVASE